MPESELPPVPEDDDLNTTVTEVMTDVEVLLDFEISERKLTESDRKLSPSV